MRICLVQCSDRRNRLLVGVVLALAAFFVTTTASTVRLLGGLVSSGFCPIVVCVVVVFLGAAMATLVPPFHILTLFLTWPIVFLALTIINEST